MVSIRMIESERPSIGNAEEVCLDEFTDAALQLFQHYAGERPTYHRLRSSFSDLAADSEGELVCSSIGLVSPRCRCSIGLIAPVRSLPMFSVQHDTPADWVGELTNQLAGRFKNHLQAYGVNLQLGLPMSVEGKSIKFAWNGAEYLQFRFLTPAGVFLTAIQLYVDPDDVWSTEYAVETAAEGSVELF